MKQKELPTKTVNELKDSEAEGSIQNLFLDQEIKVTNATIKEDNNGEKAVIQIIDSAGSERIAYSYGTVIVSDLQEWLTKGLGKDFAVSCIVRSIAPQNGGKNYLKLEQV